LGKPADTGTLGGHLDAAADAIHDLHRLTAGCVTADDALVERWIDGPVRELAAGAGRLPGGAARLQRVQQELHDAVEGRTFSVGAIHGDYWFGNVLFSHAQPTGIVDWDAAGTAELPVMDILHLLLFARCLASGRSFGDVVCRQLARPDWSARERRLLARYAGSE
jgi:aminoglycoside phosphotransferase (APT) family kinase protein